MTAARERYRAYYQQREADRIAKNELLREMTLSVLRGRPEGMTVAAIAKQVSLNPKQIGHVMARLKRDGEVHIAGSVISGNNKPASVFSSGDGPDVTRAVKSRTPTDMIEREIEATVSRKHEAWKQTWTPHPDPASAWLTNRIQETA